MSSMFMMEITTSQMDRPKDNVYKSHEQKDEKNTIKQLADLMDIQQEEVLELLGKVFTRWGKMKALAKMKTSRELGQLAATMKDWKD
ncbi:hypothetical protein L0F63_005366 [Massospora cicadina]|nr:hypothetical protein L0F63_005366 [Massospora cicadina]